MFQGYLGLRRANESDSATIWHWANENRKTAISTAYIPWEIHTSWFKAKLKDSGCYIWIMENPFSRLGQIRYDVVGDKAFIDINISPTYWRYGLGRYLIGNTFDLLFEKCPQIKTLVAEIRADNTASRRFFASLGFQKAKEGGIETWAKII